MNGHPVITASITANSTATIAARTAGEPPRTQRVDRVIRTRLGAMALILLGTGVLGLWSAGPADGAGVECVSRCNMQYLGSIKQCDQILSQNGRRDWHEDCVKNAGRFRLDCLRHCR